MRDDKPHMVWWKFPTCDHEVVERFATRAEADSLADALRDEHKDGTDLGKVEIWVESPGTIEAKLRELHEEYEEGR
jgi:hypothetical protein